MARLLLAAFLVATLAGVVRADFDAEARATIEREMPVWLDPFAGDQRRAVAYEKLIAVFDANPELLADVDALEGFLRVSPGPARPFLPPGFHRREIDLSSLGVTKRYPYAVSVPGYGEPGKLWPLVICVPAPGVPALDHLDLLRDRLGMIQDCLVVAVEAPASETMTRSVLEKGPDGRLVQREITEELPSDWRSSSIDRFWRTYLGLIVKELRVDPQRIVVRGGSDAAWFAAGTTWRFAGLILDGEILPPVEDQNLSYLPVYRDEVPDAAAFASWLEGCVRRRYPLPARWLGNPGRHREGYWTSVTAPLEPGRPIEVFVDRGEKNTIVLETKNVAELTLFLNDRIADLDEPVRLEVNGESFGRRFVERSADRLLRSALVGHVDSMLPRDPGVVFTAKLAVRVAKEPEPPVLLVVTGERRLEPEEQATPVPAPSGLGLFAIVVAGIVAAAVVALVATSRRATP